MERLLPILFLRPEGEGSLKIAAVEVARQRVQLPAGVDLMLADKTRDALLARAKMRRIVQPMLDMQTGEGFQLAAQILQNKFAVDTITPCFL